MRRRGRAGSHFAIGFAPGHVTGIFVPSVSSTDPRAQGSIGAGLVLDLGATAFVEWIPGRRRRIELRSDVRGPLPISRDVATRLTKDAPGALRIELRHALPIGQGFGMSAAGALATGLAVSAALGAPRSAAIEAAHLAELVGGGGLGGVAAILGGGMELRRAPGIPPHGQVEHRPFPLSCFVGTVGAPLSSPKLLASPRFLDRVRITGTPGLERLFRRPSASRFLKESETFGDALGLGSQGLHRLIRSLRGDSVAASQAMFGRSFFAVPRNAGGRSRVVRALQRRNVRVVELPTAAGGAFARRVPALPTERLLLDSRVGRRS
jgi:pantoate kinase